MKNISLLAVAPNGARKTKDDLPNIPLTPEEIGAEAKACMIAGAAMIHLHVRNHKGNHSLNDNFYREAIQQIKDQTDDKLFIQATSESVGKYSSDEQFEMIHSLKPSGVSIGINEIKRHDELELNEHFNWMRQNNIYPQLILYNQHDLSIYKNWLEDGILPGNGYPVLLVIGKPQLKGGFDRDALEVELNLSASSWMVCAFGEQEYQIGKRAAELGGHIRLGFENNNLLDDGSAAQNNAELIAQMAQHLKAENRELATVENAKKLMMPDW